MAQPLIGTASTDNPPGSRWCGCNLRWGQDPGCTYKDKVVVVSVPHDGGWEDWWRGGMVGYTPGGTAPPLRLSPHRPCQGASETGNISRPSAHGTPTDLRNRCSRGQVPAECLEQKMLYAYATVCTQGDFTLSRK